MAISSLLLGTAPLVEELIDEQRCGSTTNPGSTSDYRKWDPCDFSPSLMFYITSYSLAVPDDTEIRIKIDQNISLDSSYAEMAPTTAKWRPTISKDSVVNVTNDDYWLE